MPKPAGATRLCQPVLSLLAAVLLSAGASAADWRYDGVGRIVAISDVHGAYASMVKTLGKAGILGDEGSWAGGSAHLVVTGDLVDRGADSRKVMDLLIQLEGEAAEAGGRVHVLLGNHEVMNLTGDLRYVAAAEYEAFAADEVAEDRERALAGYLAARPDAPDAEAARREFGLRAPPGYFGHRRAFAPDGRYGEWLLGKPLIVVINGTAFVHGGLSPMVAELGLDGVNGELKAQVTRYAEQLEVVIQAGLLDPTENFYRHGALLEALPPDPARAAEVAEAIADVIALNAGSVHETESPVWYRGNVGCGALIENDKLDAALAALDARRVVIGHTPTITRKVLQRLGGRVIEIDTGMLTSAYGGTGNALVIEGDSLTVVNETETASLGPVAHPRPAPQEAGTLTAAQLEQILAEGEVLSVAEENGRTVVRLRNGSSDLPAVFAKNPRKGFAPELAAYRLDRLLDLGMVPVTVAREVDGQQGTLQVFTANAKNELGRRESGEGAGAWCPLPEQWNAMYIFDALAYNALRHQQSILYHPGNWQLMLVDHERSFAAKSGKPDWLRKAGLSIGDAWAEALSSLTEETLQQHLGDVLDKRRLGSLVKRRDELLEEAGARNAAAAGAY